MSTNQDNHGSTTEMPIITRNIIPEDETKNMKKLPELKRVLFSCGVAIFFIGLAGCVASMTVPSLRKMALRGIEMWKWWMLITALLGGPVLSRAIFNLVLLCINRECTLKVDGVYYIVGLVKSAWVVLWCGIILLAWTWIVDEPSYLGVPQATNKEKIERKFDKTEKVLTQTLATILVGSFLWLLKELALVIAKSSFHVNRFFDRIRDTLMHEYVILILSSPDGNPNNHEAYIDLSEEEGKNKKNVTCWEMKNKVKEIIKGRQLRYVDKHGVERTIQNESDARIAADVIFSNNLVHHDHEAQCSFVETTEVERKLAEHFKNPKEVIKWLLVGADDPTMIDRNAFEKFMVRAWKQRTSLCHSLVDNKELFQALNRTVNLILIFVIFIGWLFVLNVQIRKAMFVVGSAIVGSAFIFGDFSKKLLDNFAFVFVVHPFDVGDCCLINNTPVIITEMSLLTTTALTMEDELRHYPNSVLCSSIISNYTRSPPQMGDSVAFSLDITTPPEKIKELRKKIQEYIESNSHYWNKEHELAMELDAQDMTKIKATLQFKHTINYHDLRERQTRRSKLISQLKAFLNDLSLLPNTTTSTSNSTTPVKK